jgi:hypothetical protein
MKMPIFPLSLLCLVLLAGCAGPTPLLPVSPTLSPDAKPYTPTLAAALLPTPTPTDALLSTETAVPSATLPPSPTITATPPVTIAAWPGPLYEVLFTIPANTGTGIRYRNLGVAEALVEGPNTFSILADGSYVIHDIVNKGIVLYSATGEFIRGIHFENLLPAPTAADLAASGEMLYVLQEPWGPLPAKYWLHELSSAGELLASYELPPHITMESGLTGLTVGPDGSVLAEMEGGLRLIELLDASGRESGLQSPGLTLNGQVYWAEGAAGGAGEARFRTQLSEMGGMQILGINPDGSFYVVRQDVLTRGSIQVDVTVHLLSPQGEQLAAARYPITEWLYPPRRFLARGPDGQVYGILPLRSGLHLIRLIFYERLDPFLPGAADPFVSAAP